MISIQNRKSLMKAVSGKCNSALAVLLLFISTYSAHLLSEERLLGNVSMTTIEGASGGLIVPWATIGKGDANEGLSVSLNAGVAETDDFSMDSLGTFVGIVDWLEVSFARLSLQRDQSADVIRQNIFGLKLRLNNGYIYDTPLWSLGFQYKTIDNSNDFSFLSFDDRKGADFFLAASYMPLAAFMHRNLILSGNVRYTKANEIGFAGFGSEQSSNDKYELLFEASLALQLSSRILLGAEYRDKANNLDGVTEDPWSAVYFNYSPVSQVSIGIAWIDLGELLGGDKQQGALVSVEASF